MRKHLYLINSIWGSLKRKHKFLLVFSILLSVLGVISEILLAFSAGLILNSLININSLKEISKAGSTSYYIDYNLPFALNLSIEIKFFTVIFILFALFSLLIRLYEKRISTYNGALITIYFSSNIIQNLITLGYPSLSKISKAESVVLISRGTDLFLDSITAYLAIASNLTNISILILAAFLINIYAGIFVAIFLILINTIFKFFTTNLVNDFQKRYKRLLDKQISFIDLLITFPREMILMFNQRYFIDDFIKNETKLRKLASNNNFAPQGFRIILENFLLISLIGIPSFYRFFFNAPLSPNVIISVICFLKCLPYILVFLQSKQVVETMLSVNQNYVNFFKDSKLKLKDKKNIMGFIEFDKSKSNIKKLDKNFKLALENVSYYYDSDKKILNKINLDFKRGNNYAIVGKSGSGKSTLLDIISGLVRPNEGSILINGKKVDSYLEFNFLRNLFAYQSQKSFLLNDSIKNNIIVGKKFDQKLYNLSLDVSGIKELINNLPKGSETLLGNSVKKVSGGQEQRICLARAIYCDSPILVFDEPTSALDKKLEESFFYNLSKIPKDRMIILVTHNIKSIPKDFIIYSLD